MRYRRSSKGRGPQFLVIIAVALISLLWFISWRRSPTVIPVVAQPATTHAIISSMPVPSTPSPTAYQAPVDVHLIVIWHGALQQRQKILNDVGQRLHVVDIRYFDWSGGQTHGFEEEQDDYFLMNLWRLYSGKGGRQKQGMKLKVKQCGRGPFIGLVVVDPTPQYKTETTAHGDDYVNHNLNSAKILYRKWSGGGFRVHGTFNPQEAAHDVSLMFHKHPATYAEEYRTRARQGLSHVEHGAALLQRFQQLVWPPSRDAAGSFYGTEGTLGLDAKAFAASHPVLPAWPSCSVLLEALVTPWPAAEQERLRREGFYAWDNRSGFPSEHLSLSMCKEGKWPEEWAIVVLSGSRWAMTSLLNSDLRHVDASTEVNGTPLSVEIAVGGTKHRVHIRTLLPEDLF